MSGLPPEVVRERVCAELEVIDAAQARLRGLSTDLVGNAFRVEVAGRLETQERVNRGLSYRVFGEIADPPDGPDDPGLPAGGEGDRCVAVPVAPSPPPRCAAG